MQVREVTRSLALDREKRMLSAPGVGSAPLTKLECEVAAVFNSKAGYALRIGELFSAVRHGGYSLSDVRKAIDALTRKAHKLVGSEILFAEGEGQYRWLPVYTCVMHEEDEPQAPPRVPAALLAQEAEAEHSQDVEPLEAGAAPDAVWPPERIQELIRLWEEGVPTAEMGRRIGVTKNAVFGKVHRLGLTPRFVAEKPAPRRNVFDFQGPVCMWPIGHPNEADFHFCGEQPAPGKPYCTEHAAVAYIRPKERPEAA